MVYVLNCKGRPAMPCSPAKARRLLKQGKAKVIRRKPFTIQLTDCYGTAVDGITVGIDSGYKTIGFSAMNQKQELLCGELDLLSEISERLKEKAMYRRPRRNRLRYRRAKADQRRGKEGWLAPSMKHKMASHISLVGFIKAILPVSRVIIEVASFDIHRIKNPEIEGKEYQEGEQQGFSNLREYILYRDSHECQNPDCTNKAKEKVLEVHHIGYWKGDRTDRPGNLITLCTKCHTPGKHKKKGFLYGWEPKVKSFRPESFMNIARWKLVTELECEYTYGYETKKKRKELGLEKTHHHDAFVIAGGKSPERSTPIYIEQIRRNNRALQKFYDAKYIDVRTGEKVGAQELNNGRRTRNKNLTGENLKKYRGKKVSQGYFSVRRQRYAYQPGDLVKVDKKIYLVKGVFNYGTWVRLTDKSGNIVNIAISKVQLLKYQKGIAFGL
jgi:hypothetical protein